MKKEIGVIQKLNLEFWLSEPAQCQTDLEWDLGSDLTHKMALVQHLNIETHYLKYLFVCVIIVLYWKQQKLYIYSMHLMTL